MKRNIFAVKALELTAAFAVLAGCANTLPDLISKDVYASKRDAIVERNKLDQEKSITGIQAQERLRQRAEVRQELVLKELKTAPGENTKLKDAVNKDAISSDGITGGFKSIILNDSACDAIVNLIKMSGDYAGVTWSFHLRRQGGEKKLALEADNYEVSWSFGTSPNIHPRLGEGDRFMTVHDNPRFPYEKENYYGAYRIRGWSCN